MYIRRWHHISLAVPLEHFRELMIPHLLGYDEYKAVSSNCIYRKLWLLSVHYFISACSLLAIERQL